MRSISDPGEFKPVAGKSAAWNRGAYIVEGLAHCGLCHTPKNAAGGDETAQRFKGYELQGWFAPDITTDKRRGIGSWSVEDIATYLKTGHNRFTAASGPMAEVVEDSTSKLTDEDLNAIAVYLKDQPVPTTTEAAGDPDAGMMKSGAAVYAVQCAACHGADGGGVDGLFPTLKGSALVQSVDPASVLHVVLRGSRSAATDPAPTAAGDAVVRLDAQRFRYRRGLHLCAQCLGQPGAADRCGDGRQDAPCAGRACGLVTRRCRFARSTHERGIASSVARRRARVP